MGCPARATRLVPRWPQRQRLSRATCDKSITCFLRRHLLTRADSGIWWRALEKNSDRWSRGPHITGPVLHRTGYCGSHWPRQSLQILWFATGGCFRIGSQHGGAQVAPGTSGVPGAGPGCPGAWLGRPVLGDHGEDVVLGDGGSVLLGDVGVPAHFAVLAVAAGGNGLAGQGHGQLVAWVDGGKEAQVV